MIEALKSQMEAMERQMGFLKQQTLILENLIREDS
jgi:hypothetical protein